MYETGIEFGFGFGSFIEPVGIMKSIAATKKFTCKIGSMNGRKGRSQLESQNDSHCILIDKFGRHDGKTVRFWFTRWKFKYTGIQYTRSMRVNLNIMQFFAVCLCVSFVIIFRYYFPSTHCVCIFCMHSIRIRGTQWIAVAHCFHPFSNLCARSLFEQTHYGRIQWVTLVLEKTMVEPTQK